jgi:ABC-2 type transport system ATP-binding protein
MIQIKDLNFLFKNQQILNNVNLDLSMGNCYGLLGVNGSGKSTLLNCIANILPPNRGQIVINDLVYKENAVQIKKLFGFVLELNPLIEDFTGWQYMNFIGILHGLEGDELKKKVTSVVSFFFDDPDVLVKTINTFSTGMKKKLSVCAAIIHQPSYLVLDEPFAGLDILAAKKLIDFIKFYMNENRLVLVSSHDLHYINEIATDILVIHESKIIFNDTLTAFVDHGDRQIDEALYKYLVPESLDYNWGDILWLK